MTSHCNAPTLSSLQVSNSSVKSNYPKAKEERDEWVADNCIAWAFLDGSGVGGGRQDVHFLLESHDGEDQTLVVLKLRVYFSAHRGTDEPVLIPHPGLQVPKRTG